MTRAFAIETNGLTKFYGAFEAVRGQYAAPGIGLASNALTNREVRS